jgi:late competence protein required for DNA uptake (superfamily II DNA/RNA helicase)
MKERDLEETMIRFLNKEVDVLVCTTIIESGLDIPSVNTIIINEVDRLGLAQIYQLRGGWAAPMKTPMRTSFFPLKPSSPGMRKRD